MRVLLTILCVTVLVTMAAPGLATDSTAISAGDPQPGFTLINLDAMGIATRARAHDPITLPTMWGDVLITSFQRVSAGVRINHEDPQGALVDDGVFVPDVWHVASLDYSITGLLLADGHQVRATLITPEGRSTIEAGANGIASSQPERLHRMYSADPTRPLFGVSHDVMLEPTTGPQPAPVPPAGVGVLTTQTKTMVAYVDDEFAGVWGTNTWPNHVIYLTSWLNGYMNDVELIYDVQVMTRSDPGTSSWSTAWSWLGQRNYQGMNTRVFWSHVDYTSGGWCNLGMGSQPGTTAMLQTTDDACHGWHVIDTDFERAYFMAHELGHNNNAAHVTDNAGTSCQSCPWSSGGYPHTHRSIMYQDTEFHLHECWSNTNANRMATHLGTSVVATTCN